MEYIISLVQYTEHYTDLITGITRMKKNIYQTSKKFVNKRYN